MKQILINGEIVTMNATRDVLAGGAIVFDEQAIIAVGSTQALLAEHGGDDQISIRDVSGCVVTPGMVNAHQHHTGDPLVRSCIPDLVTSEVAIFEWAVPIHSNHSPDDDQLAATLTAVESLRNGVTTVVEAGTVADADRVAAGMLAAGVRGTVGTWGWDIDDAPFAAPFDEVLDRQRAVVDRYPAGGRVEGWVTLVGHDLASDDLLGGAADLARELGTSMTMHLSPTSNDPASYLERTGRRPVVHLDHLGVLGRHLLLAHGVWLDDAEIELVLSSGTAIAYCPWAYLRLGQGVTRAGRHAEIVERGGRVALGCDAVNAGDAADILRTAALAAGLARDGRLDPLRFGAHQAFELATISGAAAVGMDDRVGSLEPGKQADIVVHDAADWGWSMGGDVALQLVWGTDGRSVRDVWVGGEQVIADRHSTRVDEAELYAQAATAQHELLGRAGISLPSVWPRRDAR